jgi:signal-transduction protein with cAMP-binding, CBS, and nucleotidyltransferase domain
MEQIKMTMRQMIGTSDEELDLFLAQCYTEKFKRLEVLSVPGKVPTEIFFILKGILRVLVIDNFGTEHSIHFAMENQFIADYSSFILRQNSSYTLQALEETEVIVIPKQAIDWGYNHIKEGQKLGRLIAEYYFIYQDNRIKNMYSRTPKERFDNISEVFPNIHNRVPQHMIASYLGISPVHLSRLKSKTK